VFALRLLLASAGMVGAILLFDPGTEAWLGWPWQQRALAMAALCLAGLATYTLSHLVLGTRPRHLRAP
jgi:putative peptidoglycan lipid II flippase